MRYSVAIAIPVTITPAMFAFPALAVNAAAIPGFAKLVALMLGLTAVKAVAIDLALELPFLLVNPSLAFVEVMSVGTARGAEQQKPAKHRGDQRGLPNLCESS